MPRIIRHVASHGRQKWGQANVSVSHSKINGIGQRPRGNSDCSINCTSTVGLELGVASPDDPHAMHDSHGQRPKGLGLTLAAAVPKRQTRDDEGGRLAWSR